METQAQVAPAPPCPPEDVFERLRHRLERQVRAHRIPAQDADDLVQQTLIALFDQYDEVRDPEPWAMGVLRKHCLMYWRSRRRRIYDSVDDTVLEWLAAPEVPSQERRDLKNDLATAMDRLPDHYRSVILLRYGLGMEPAEVAAELGYRASSIGKVTLRSLAAMNRAMIACGYCEGPPVR